MKLNATIRIASREYDLIADPDTHGASFDTMGNTGRGRIIIGTSMNDPAHIATLVLHEILESIMSESGVRYHDTGSSDTNYLFVFNHNYLHNLVPMLLDALVSCGLVVLPKTIQIPGDRRRGNGKRSRSKKNHTDRSQYH